MLRRRIVDIASIVAMGILPAAPRVCCLEARSCELANSLAKLTKARYGN